MQLLIDISWLPGPQQHAVARWTDRQTDGQQLHRPCSTYYVGRANRCCIFTLTRLTRDDLPPAAGPGDSRHFIAPFTRHHVTHIHLLQSINKQLHRCCHLLNKVENISRIENIQIYHTLYNGTKYVPTNFPSSGGQGPYNNGSTKIHTENGTSISSAIQYDMIRYEMLF